MPATTSASFAHPLVDGIAGECLQADERLVIAPDTGVFEPAVDLCPGAPVAVGQVIGHLTTQSRSVPVVSPFAGRAGDTLAWRGERLTAHQPVMWLSTTTGRP